MSRHSTEVGVVFLGRRYDNEGDDEEYDETKEMRGHIVFSRVNRVQAGRHK